MRLHWIALASLAMLGACASQGDGNFPDVKGPWVDINPPGFDLPPLPEPTRHAYRARPHRAVSAPAPAVRTAETHP